MLEAKLKDGRQIKFRFKTTNDEIELVRKFQLGMMSDKSVLDLKEHGKITIGQIVDMWKIDPNKRVIVPEEVIKDKELTVVNIYENCTFMGDDLIDDIMRGKWTQNN